MGGKRDLDKDFNRQLADLPASERRQLIRKMRQLRRAGHPGLPGLRWGRTILTLQPDEYITHIQTQGQADHQRAWIVQILPFVYHLLDGDDHTILGRLIRAALARRLPLEQRTERARRRMRVINAETLALGVLAFFAFVTIPLAARLDPGQLLTFEIVVGEFTLLMALANLVYYRGQAGLAT